MCNVIAAALLAVLVSVAAVPFVISAAHAQTDYPELGVRVETVADNLRVPWSIDWLPDGTVVFTERGGTVSTLNDYDPLPIPILSLDVQGGEGGLLGVAVDPDFAENQFIYVYYTYRDLLSSYNKVVRYEYDADGAEKLHGAHTIIDKIPAGIVHDGGRIQFGPDGMLYVATGDAMDPNLSQDTGSLAGKILRINPDGSIPDDNPWADSPVYSTGHRNPQGMDWNDRNILVATEHGPSGWIGTGHDEINVIMPGKNYGWPHVIGSNNGDDNDSAYEDPVFHTGSVTWAPSGSEFYESDNIPEWQDRYFVASLLGKSLWMLEFDSDAGDELQMKSYTALFPGEFGRLRDVQTGPDGNLYVLTSNQDGRGIPGPNDDQILRIVPLYDTAMANGSVQKLETFLYEGNETAASTGPLYAALRHPGYDVLPMSFDISQKSLEFEFALDDHSQRQSEPAASSLSLYIKRPLLSPPYEVIIYDESDNVISHDENTRVTTKYSQDNYVIIFDTDIERGRIMVIGTHVIPEYAHVMIAMTVSAAAALGGILACGRLASGRTGIFVHFGR